MQEPWFWRENGAAARLAAAALSPAALAYDAGQRLRTALTRPTAAATPIVCVGNATTGGVGKTPTCIALAALFGPRLGPVAFLSRGYGGRARGPIRVDAAHHAADAVGDEPLLLARIAPTIVARRRTAGARAAAGTGARLIIMDDGFQNPSLVKDASVLVIDAGDPAGNGRLFPAGPLREPLGRASARADAIVLVGEDAPGRTIDAGPAMLFRARMVLSGGLPDGPVVAFCGIGRPQRFFDALRRNGVAIAKAVAFPDHHRYTPAEIDRLRALATRHQASLLTTEKDHVRLAEALRADIAPAPAMMVIDEGERLADALIAAIARRRRGWPAA